MADYNKHTWESGELIDAEKMNNLEDGVAAAVPNSRTINGVPLTNNVSLSAALIGAVNKAGDTMTGRLNGPNITTYASEWPGFRFSLDSTGDTSLGSLNFDQLENHFSFITKTNDGSSGREFYSLPISTATGNESTEQKYDILTTKQTLTSVTAGSDVSITSGGLIKLGRVCIITMSITTTANLSSSTIILKNFPVPLSQAVINVSSGVSAFTARLYQSNLYPNTTLPSGDYTLNGVYITAS